MALVHLHLHFKTEKPLSPHTNLHNISWDQESSHSCLMTEILMRVSWACSPIAGDTATWPGPCLPRWLSCRSAHYQQLSCWPTATRCYQTGTCVVPFEAKDSRDKCVITIMFSPVQGHSLLSRNSGLLILRTCARLSSVYFLSRSKVPLLQNNLTMTGHLNGQIAGKKVCKAISVTKDVMIRVPPFRQAATFSSFEINFNLSLL